MPFRIDLNKKQQPKVWHSVSDTPAARALQELYDNEDSEGYKKLLAQYREQYAKETGNATRQKHDFRLTDGKVYEIWDRGETKTTPIQLMVKGSVITWSFSSGKDETHQEWRDKVFNTAAVAHQSVEFGCETYYRGSNAYHLKKMHSYRGESDFNHNHYRLINDRPITPKDLEEHLRAFYNQTNGKEFIPDEIEVDSIIGKYKMYWAEYELDPRFSAYYPVFDQRKREAFFDELLAATTKSEREEALDNYCTKVGIPQPVVEQAFSELMTQAAMLNVVAPTDRIKLKKAMERAANSEFKNFAEAVFWAQENGLEPAKKYALFIQAFNEFNAKVNFTHDFQVKKGNWPPDDKDVREDDDYLPYESIAIHGTHAKGSSPSSSINSGSPSEQYEKALDQIMNWDDEVEFKLFAEALTNRCRSIDDAMLGTLRPEDFRKALRLYNAMKHLNNGKVTVDASETPSEDVPTPTESTPASGRFSAELFTKVLRMRSEISGMVEVGEDPGPALAPIFSWLKTASPELEKWLVWVEENGSRGLGAEIAHTREQYGTQITRHSFFTEMDDRREGANVANVLSLKPKSSSAEGLLAFKVRTYLQSIMHQMGDPTYIDKSKVADVLIDILEGKKTYDTLQAALERFPRWDDAEISDKLIKGNLTELVSLTRELKDSSSPSLSNY